MPIKEMPKFKSTEDKTFQIPQPGIGGINLKDIEYEQGANQSPYMLNMMYRNGIFGKRYGQEAITLETIVSGTVTNSINTPILNIISHVIPNPDPLASDDEDRIEAIFIRTDVIDNNQTVGKIFMCYKTEGSGYTIEDVTGSTTPYRKGQFIQYDQKLYYMCQQPKVDGKRQFGKFYEYKDEIISSTRYKHFVEVEPYVPSLVINCRPDGSSENGAGTVNDRLNILSRTFAFECDGDGESDSYFIFNYDKNYIKWYTPQGQDYPVPYDLKVYVDGNPVENNTTNGWAYRRTNGKHIQFYGTAIPGIGENNVKFVFTLHDGVLSHDLLLLTNSDYHETYGGGANSRLFLGGSGEGLVYWSHPYDCTYFPDDCWTRLGSKEDDITGFGKQYNVLLAFKPREVYAFSSYIYSAATTADDSLIGTEGLDLQMVNARIGCDCPYSIQLINNLLTWYSSYEGVCTLVSTNIQDERNIRVISRNIERANSLGTKGVLDYTFGDGTNDEVLTQVESVDYDGKYFLVFPKSGMAYVWDYAISPYRYSSSGETDPRTLSWFVFDHIYARQFCEYNKELYFTSGYSYSWEDEEQQEHSVDYTSKLIKLNNTFDDLDFDGDGTSDGIKAYYMTPLLQFGAVEWLKTVKNVYVQTRGGNTSSHIKLYYYTDESAEGEDSGEPIIIGGRLWNNFHWNTFQWTTIPWAKTFRRKCNLKKIEMAAFYFENDELHCDMCISHIGLEYQLVKHIR